MVLKSDYKNHQAKQTQQVKDSMAENSKEYRKKELQICAIEKTSERLTGRAGLSLFVTYLHRINIFPLIDRFFKTIRKSQKGLPVFEIFKQVLCFMADGTSRHVSYFDHLTLADLFERCKNAPAIV